VQIAPVHIYAQPPAFLGEIRNAVESRVNRHNRQRGSRDSALFLASVQDGLNRAIKRQGVTIAPLTRRIFA
jgi:hypothetical protein